MQCSVLDDPNYHVNNQFKNNMKRKHTSIE